MKRSSETGYTLIVVMVLLGALSVLGMAAVSMASAQLEAANAHAREASLEACADAARNLMMSQLRFGTQVPKHFSMVLVKGGLRDREVLESDETARDTAIVSGEQVLLDMGEGHDPGAAPAVIADIQFLSDAMLGKGKSTGGGADQGTNDEWVAVGGGEGGAAGVRVVARCRDKVGRTREVEFMIRYGI